MRKNWIRIPVYLLVMCLVVNNCIWNNSMLLHAAENSNLRRTVSMGDAEETALAVDDGINSDLTVSEGDAKTENILSILKPNLLTTTNVSMANSAVMSVAEGISAVTLPKTRAEFVSSVQSGEKSFYIMSYADLLLVEDYCKYEDVNGFEGIRLIFGEEAADGGNWIISDTDFEGIGTSEYPFKGEIQHYFSNIKLNLKTPLLKYVGNGANIHDLNITMTGGCAAIAENVTDPDNSNVTVNISNVTLSGTVKNSGGAAGMIAGHIASNSALTLTNVTGSGLTVEGAQAGGIAGTAGNNVTVTLGEGVSLAVAVTGTETAGGHFGTVTGSANWSLTDESSGKLVAAVKGNSASCNAGQFAGKLVYDAQSGDETAELNITDGTTVEVNVSGTGNGGGFIGFLGTNTKITKPDGNLTISGSVSMDWNTSNVGGVAGVMENTSMELADYTITAYLNGNYTGGLVGEIRGGKFIIGDVMIQKGTNDTLNANIATGGIAGSVISSAAIEIQGTLEFAGNVYYIGGSKPGLVVGVQDKSLIYFAEIEGKFEATGEKQLIAGNLGDKEEIGTYGGVYRNQSIGTGNTTKKLIGDGTLENVGVINNTITKSGDDYVLTSAADFETLAIVLGTEGAYGTVNADGNAVFAGVTQANYADLLAETASYLVQPASGTSIDISYEKTGIVTLNRNDKETAAYAFCGKLYGAEATPPTIIQNTSVKQDRLGLFSTLAGNAEFANLTIEGTVTKANGAGGLAYQSIGTGLTLSNITMQKTFNNNSDYIGGVLAKAEGTDSVPFEVVAEQIKLMNEINAGSVKTSSGFITMLSKANVTMSDITLGGSFYCTSTEEYGGFLGHEWTKMGGTVENVVVAPGTTYQADGRFGCLLGRLETALGKRLTLKDVDLANLTVGPAAKDNFKGKSGLLVQKAKKAILEVIDYSCKGCTVKNVKDSFDEIVGETKDSSSEAFSQTGIVSIHRTEDGYFPTYYYQLGENYATYENDSRGSKTNVSTMYFYDVFQRLENADGTVKTQISSDGVLDTVDEMLIWDILHYAHDENVWKTFNQNYVASPYSKYTDIYWENYTFSGNLDLSEISFYPVPRAGGKYTGDGAEISFNAVGMDSWTLNNIDETSQHYALQAGLFCNTPNQLNVTDITLSGKVANLDTESGALVCGAEGLTNGGNLFDIIIDDLWVNGYQSECEPIGLLISNIPGGKVQFDGVHMDKDSYASAGDNKVAAALIGSAGGEDVTNLILNFHDMIIADDRDDRTDGTHNGKVMGWASFLFNYNYTDEASINEGYGLYLFSERDDEKGYVTYGEELDFDTEFSDNSNKVFTEGQDPDPATIYKPYVYQIKDIEVNPKSGDILMGCGTYDDPYIITDIKQFLTLYRYMNETGNAEDGYKYETFYKDWKVIIPGDDKEVCTKKHAVKWNAELDGNGDGVAEGGFESLSGIDSHAEDAAVFGDADFPTPDDMSRAYYRLDADIDLSKKMSSTYETIAQEFVGFGTQERPFVGVWYGKASDSDEVYTVTLPNKASDATYETYGFIQYAMGAVVKDINIKTDLEVGEGEEAIVPTQIKTMGGGVIACILGGDNVIDNVTVDVTYKVADTNAIIGGYVGNVKKGGLILRNVADTGSENPALDGFALDTSAATASLVGAIAGKVEDGYVVYEGGAGDSYVWSGKGGSSLTQIPNYDVLYITALEAATGTISVANVSNNITFSIPTAADLQIMTMALNADALNVRPSDYAKYTVCGYTENSRSRKADYSDISCNTATTDYINAASYDNVMSYNDAANKAYAYPYLYDYLGIGADYEDYYVVDSEKGYSILNPAAPIASTDYHIDWKLTGTAYDMSQFGKSFRGIGAIYQTGAGYGGTFHGDFDGNDSIITLAMKRIRSKGDADEVARQGFFNLLYAAEAAYDQTADFAKPGEAENLINCFTISNFTLTGSLQQDISYGEISTGGVVSSIVNGNYAFKGVQCEDLEITTISTSGGMIGTVVSDASYIYMEDCFVDTVSIKCFYSSAGMIANSKAKTAKIVSSTVDNLTIVPWNSNNTGLTVGGMVGDQNNTKGLLIFDGLKENAEKQIKVTNIDVNGHVAAGGLVGYTNSELVIVDAYCEAVTVHAYNHMGGMVGALAKGDNGNTALIQLVTAKNIVSAEEYNFDGQTNGIGGIVGRNDRNLTIEQAEVLGTIENDVYQCKLHTANNKSRTGHFGTGGIVGAHSSGTLTLKDCSVDKISLVADINNYNSSNQMHIGAGGIIGYVSAPVVLDKLEKNISATNLKVVAPLASESVHPVLAAGGCFGVVLGSGAITGLTDGAYCNGLTATANTVTGKYAGGLFGYVGGMSFEENKNNSTNIRLTGITVQDGTVTSDEAAGGVFGYICPSGTGTALHNTAVNTIQRMNISGRQAGGVIGEIGLYGPCRIQNVVLDDNVIIGRQTIAQKEADADCSAGGIIGAGSRIKIYWHSSNNTTRLYDLTLNNNTIVSEIIGEDVEGVVALSDGEVDHVAAGGIIGRMFENQTETVSDVLCDNISINTDAENTNKIGIRRTATEDVRLILETTINGETKYVLSDLTDANIIAAGAPVGVTKDYQALDKLEQQFGCYVGNMVGVVESTKVQLYMLCSNDSAGRFVTPVLASNPPVIDVGRNAEQAVNDYRNYCHIVYGAENSVAQVAIPLEDALTNLSDMNAAVSTVNSAFDIDKGTDILQEYRLSEEDIEIFEQVYQDEFTFAEGMKFDFPVLVYKTEYGTPQEVMEPIVNIMTNMAGNSATDLDGMYLQIEADRWLYNVNTGETAKDEEESPCITITMQDGTTAYSFSDYDGIVDGNKLSFTVLTFTYGWSAVDAGHQKVFRLPIFVEEPILFSVHTRLREGKVSDLQDLRTNGFPEGTEINMANDSDYSLLIEYTYGKARENMPANSCVEKVFSVTPPAYDLENKVKTFTEGTRLMLIDVTGGNKAYYYTVESDNISKLRFTDFEDSTGKKYVNRSIHEIASEGVEEENVKLYTDLGGHELIDTGVERFVLTVLAPKGTSNENELYELHIGTDIEDENLKERFYVTEEHQEEAVYEISAFPGLKISYNRIDDVPEVDISGTISKDGGLTVDAVAKIEAPGGYYWAKKQASENSSINMIDSSSSGKYLEFAFYLRDDSNENRVRFPAGTNFSYGVGTDGEGNIIYSDSKVVPNDAVFYYYKDIRDAFELDNWEYDISKLNGNTTVDIHFKFDFSGADMSGITEENYFAWLDLLRASDKDYPMSNGNIYDSYFKSVTANVTHQLGFAVKTTDLTQLAINTYPTAEQSDIIDYKVMFDFSQILKQATPEAKQNMLDLWTSYDYKVTYQVWKKVKDGDTVSYQRYEGTDIKLSAVEGAEDGDENGAVEGTHTLEVKYRFDSDEEKRILDEEGYLEFPCRVTVATDSLTDSPEELTNLTNYKIVATLEITEENSETQPTEGTTDFFVYTITRLKFDL